MKNFSLPSLLVGLVLGVVVGAGAMSLAGTNADNSDLQGRFGSLPSAEDLKEVDPDILAGWEGGDCDVDNCDLLEAIEDTQDLIGTTSVTIRADISDLKDNLNTQIVVTSETLRDDHSDILDEIANIDYLDRDVFWDFVMGDDGTSWTVQELADHITATCE